MSNINENNIDVTASEYCEQATAMACKFFDLRREFILNQIKDVLDDDSPDNDFIGLNCTLAKLLDLGIRAGYLTGFVEAIAVGQSNSLDGLVLAQEVYDKLLAEKNND